MISVTTGVQRCSREFLAKSYLGIQQPAGDYAYLQVVDSGVGMDQATLKCIFDPFFTTKKEGRGLGLSAVLGIIRNHKGALMVHSELGHGTSFQVFLPVCEEDPLGSPVERGISDSRPDWRGTGTILLVDDDASVRETVQKMLERLGFSVITAVDGQEGVDFFKNHADEITCVLLDLTMPRMEGERAFTEMREVREEVPIILSSGYSEKEVIQRFTGKNLSGFIPKPYRLTNLREKLRQALEA